MRVFNPGSNKGFSLIELMIVVAIVGILAVVAVPSYLKHVQRTRQAEGVHRLLDIKTAQEKFYAVNDLYFTADPLSGIAANSEFASMLNFSVADTQFHDFALTSPGAGGTVTNFQIELFSDVNEDGDSEMCWVITDSDTEPARLDNAAADSALGGDCDDSPAAEELNFTTMVF